VRVPLQTYCEYRAICCLRWPHDAENTSRPSRTGRTRKIQTIMSFLGVFCQFFRSSFMATLRSQLPSRRITRKRCSLDFSDGTPKVPLRKLKKEVTTAPVAHPLDPGHPIMVGNDALTALAAVLVHPEPQMTTTTTVASNPGC